MPSNSGTNDENPTAFAPKKPLTLDPTSYYYLHPSNNPGMNIAPVILKGNNFQEWEKGLRNSFRAKCKLEFMDGSLKKPDED